MGRAPCCDKGSVKKGPWSPEEDKKLKEYICNNGTGGNWIALPTKAGLKRCGKSCRLRWLNYLRPNIKHGEFSDKEDRVICTLFATIGSRWSIIAAQLPGRTDNDIKNYWNTKLKKKLQLLISPHSTQLQYSSRPLAPPPPPFIVEHHHNHTSSTSAASSGQLLMFGVGGDHRQRSSCSFIDISNNNSAVGLESFMFGGLQQQQPQQQQEEGTNNLFPAATAENDIMTSSGLLLLDHHQQYGGGVGSYGHHEMKPPLMISPSSFFFYGEGDGEASAAATQEGLGSYIN